VLLLSFACGGAPPKVDTAEVASAMLGGAESGAPDTVASGPADTAGGSAVTDTAGDSASAPGPEGKAFTLQLTADQYFWCGCGAECASGAYACAEGLFTAKGHTLAFLPSGDEVDWDGVLYVRSAPSAEVDPCLAAVGFWTSRETFDCP
jgi:hypothetical protein